MEKVAEIRANINLDEIGKIKKTFEEVLQTDIAVHFESDKIIFET